MELTNTNDLVVILAVIIMFTILAYLVKNNFFNQKGVFRRRGLTIGGTDMGPTTDHSGLSFDPIYTKDMVFDSIGVTVRLTDEIPDEKLRKAKKIAVIDDYGTWTKAMVSKLRKLDLSKDEIRDKVVIISTNYLATTAGLPSDHGLTIIADSPHLEKFLESEERYGIIVGNPSHRASSGSGGGSGTQLEANIGRFLGLDSQGSAILEEGGVLAIITKQSTFTSPGEYWGLEKRQVLTIDYDIGKYYGSTIIGTVVENSEPNGDMTYYSEGSEFSIDWTTKPTLSVPYNPLIIEILDSLINCNKLSSKTAARFNSLKGSKATNSVLKDKDGKWWETEDWKNPPKQTHQHPIFYGPERFRWTTDPASKDYGKSRVLVFRGGNVRAMWDPTGKISPSSDTRYYFPTTKDQAYALVNWFTSELFETIVNTVKAGAQNSIKMLVETAPDIKSPDDAGPEGMADFLGWSTDVRNFFGIPPSASVKSSTTSESDDD